MVVISAITGVLGWRTVTGIDSTMDTILEYELEARNRFDELEMTVQAATVAQRTLLNGSLAGEAREEQHAVIAKEKTAMLALGEEIGKLLTRGGT